MANSTVPQTSIEGKRVKPFGLKDQVGYMFGDFANGILFLATNLILMRFYYQVFGLNQALVGTVMMIIKFLDAFTDFGMGRIVNHVRGTKAGKFKPWILWLAAPTAISSFLMYQSYIGSSPEWAKWVYVVITYVLFNSVFYTGINIPYGSMASAITSNPQERAKLSAWRGIGPLLATLSLGFIPVIFKKQYYTDAGNLNGNFIMLMTGILAVIAIGIYLACYFMCTERVDMNMTSTQPKVSIIKSLGNIFKSRAFIILMIVTIIQVVAQFAIMNLNANLYQVAFNQSGVFGKDGVVFADYYNIASSILAILLVTPITIQLVKKFGKKIVAIWSSLGAGAAYILVFAFGPLLRKSIWAYLVISLIPYIIAGALTAITFAFITDIIDDMEVKNNVREDAPVYSMYSFLRKLSQGLAMQLSGVALAVVGWKSKNPDGSEVPIQENFHTATAVYSTLTLGSAIVFIVVGLLFLFLYPLGKKVVEKNAQILRERRAALAADNAANFSADPTSFGEASTLEAGELIVNDEILENVDANNMENIDNTLDDNDLRRQLRDYDSTHLDNNDDNNKE